MLLAHLETVSDPRRSQGRRYSLKYVLLFSILAILSGGKSYRDVGRFLNKRLKALNRLFHLNWKRAPSKSQLRDLLCALKISEVESAFRGYSQELLSMNKSLQPNRVGLDGKALRGSFDHRKSDDMLQLLSAFCAQTQLILGHEDIAEKTNEIPTAQQLIKELGLPEGTVYTADALHCQKKRSRLSKPSKGN